jgi:pilus assembly protein Flp/PilA
MLKFFKRLHQEESGQDLIEYGLIAAGIAIACIAVLPGIGTKLSAVFTSVSTALGT